MDNKFNIRKSNTVEILNLLSNTSNISRAEISKLINLNKASVSEIINSLIEADLINEIGQGNSGSSGGRKPILLELNNKAGCALGIDLGTDYVSYLLTDLQKNLLVYDYYEENINKNNVQELIVKIITSIEDKLKEYKYNLIGVTLAVHGRVYNDKILFTPYYDLDEIDLKGELSKLMPKLNFHLENEANLAAIGEFSNSAEPLNNAVVINIHSGIGSGIIVNGELYTGLEGSAGEIGHMIIVPNGKKCPCGNHGCFEQYCSMPALLDEFNSISDVKAPTIKHFSDLYKAKNEWAVATISKNIELMSIGINNISNFISPDNIFIYSELCNYIPEYLDLIKGNLNSSQSRKVNILPYKLDNKSSLYGCINRCITNFFDSFSDNL
ncbi:ROK family transcriptional regulator [Clostridium paraputrificum]|uniref:ROK family transcriptional regulator n=1 Tax=Clostridium TaxID=1485 RepID=UPI003D358365